MKLNLYNKNWIGRWPATQKREYIKVLLLLMMMIYVHRAENMPRTFNKNVDHNECDNIIYKLAH